MMAIFVRHSLLPHISGAFDHVYTVGALGGTLANKGGIMLRFRLHETSMVRSYRAK